jgi:LacI family transcriptional regulator
MSTISDVARLAGISAMTVSRVINNSGDISPETRERVEKAIADLGYVPNALARSLRFKQTKTLALVLTDITNPFFTTLARGVEDAASQQGFSVIFCNTDESESKEAEYLNVVLQKQVDGVLLVPASCSGDSVTFLQEHKATVVVLDRRMSDVKVDTVRCNSEEGAYQLTRHLLDLGHTRIAILSGPPSVSTATDRVAGYRRALAEAGPESHAELVYHGEYIITSGYRMALQALLVTPRPTALLAANNFITSGAFRAVREAGLRVPEDISIVSFDDLPMASDVGPFLTVAAQPAYEMGRRATELLLTRLSGEETAEPQEIILPIKIIVRGSSAPPPAH